MLSPSPNNALVFDAISYRYDKEWVLKSLFLNIGAGEIVCLLGPSGCGKTTALRIAAGLEVPSTGSVWVHNQIVAGDGQFVQPENRHVGLVFQDYALFPHLTVAGNIDFSLNGFDIKNKTAVIDQILADVGMLSYRDSYPNALSGGQQQRIALARVLVRKPQLILMDEPFSGLDARLRDKIRDQTLHVLKQNGVATLMVTHDAEEAMYMADRIIVMNAGTLMQTGTPEELYYQPINPFVAAFLGDVNQFEAIYHAGGFDTIIGRIESHQKFNAGQAVDILIRPEAIMLDPSDNQEERPGHARVMTTRFLGRHSLIHLAAQDNTNTMVHMHALISGRYLPAVGSMQKITLDMKQVFIFAKEA